MSSADTKLLFCNLEKKWIINQYSKWMYRKSSSVAIKLYFQPKWNIITITFTRHHYCPFNTTAHRNWFSVHFICHIFICNKPFHSHLFRRKFSQSKNLSIYTTVTANESNDLSFTCLSTVSLNPLSDTNSEVDP